MSPLAYIPRLSLNEEDVQSLANICLSEDEARVDKHGGRRAVFQYLLKLKSFGMDFTSYIDSETWERLIKKWRKIHSKAKNNRKYTAEHFQPEQLKVYFNKKQIEQIPYSDATFESSGFVDSDTRDKRIEQAVFRVSPGKQIIILDFADDRMPGSLFLYDASTQEETICYNSNIYRDVLDFKYQRFDGGFMIPEFGPIGCGAFENDTTTIIKLWKNVLSSPLNENSKTKQHDAFKEIWFLDVKDMIN
ncbi:unnamed protein product [Rotaria magnacalcarata]|uniref:Microbial-type PARG catalytic domain-containing protein n=2 Tax=Rotaria magnacalcarata TaxID=392030 RepID=A0A815B163_9BILA|nr:unnamed protein product [Rotaria magnacalcarata]CAF3767555.1 unnamed protein product [Rotaria magnacalcarata]CAF3844203.1 unnamed protein product [Rotaria magnacalcarata]